MTNTINSQVIVIIITIIINNIKLIIIILNKVFMVGYNLYNSYKITCMYD